jgi:hypothetical protein
VSGEADGDAEDADERRVEAPDPRQHLPTPTVEVPDPTAVEPDPRAEDESDTDTETPTVEVPNGLWVSFWYLVVVFNLAVLALGVGLLLLTLGDDPELAARLLFAGAVIGAYGYYKYRTNPYRDGVDTDAETGG